RRFAALDAKAGGFLLGGLCGGGGLLLLRAPLGEALGETSLVLGANLGLLAHGGPIARPGPRGKRSASAHPRRILGASSTPGRRGAVGPPEPCDAGLLTREGPATCFGAKGVSHGEPDSTARRAGAG